MITLLIMIITGLLEFLFFTVILEIVAWCLGLTVSLKVIFGLWLIFLILKSLFKGGK